MFRWLSIAAGVLLGACAEGGQIPAPEAGAPQVNCRVVDGQLEVRDAASGAFLISAQGLRLVQGSGAGVTSELIVQSQPTGADLIVKLTNTSSDPQPAGSLSTGAYNLGTDIEHLDPRGVARMVAINGAASGSPSFGSSYPDDCYAPVMVLKNAKMAIGISLLYPAMQYKHDIATSIRGTTDASAGAAGPGWIHTFSLSNGDQAAPKHLHHPALIPPGESRTYVISIRITREPADWITTLTPYRDYFRELYGGVQYMRRTAPVRGFMASSPDEASEQNPLGYRPDLRPDLNGWGSTVDLLTGSDWKHQMIWGLSGISRAHSQPNYPYLAASPLRSNPALATIFDPAAGLAKAAQGGREVGVWWGHSLEICAQWGSATSTTFNPEVVEHRDAQLREVQALYDTGARCIALGDFSHRLTPVWTTIPWMRDMQGRFPGLTFVTAPAMCDLLHVASPSWAQNPEGALPSGANVLADFLVPGHETWVTMNGPLNKRPAPPLAALESDIRRLASWGNVPVVFTDANCPKNVSIARSWELSLPKAVVDTDTYIQALKAGRLPNYSAPVVANQPAPPAPPAPAQPPQAKAPSASPPSTAGGKPSTKAAETTQPAPKQPETMRGTRKTTGFLGIRPSTKSPDEAPDPEPAPSKPRIAVTVTERFKKRVPDPKIKADRTQALLDKVKKQEQDDED